MNAPIKLYRKFSISSPHFPTASSAELSAFEPTLFNRNINFHRQSVSRLSTFKDLKSVSFLITCQTWRNPLNPRQQKAFKNKRTGENRFTNTRRVTSAGCKISPIYLKGGASATTVSHPRWIVARSPIMSQFIRVYRGKSLLTKKVALPRKDNKYVYVCIQDFLRGLSYDFRSRPD